MQQEPGTRVADAVGDVAARVRQVIDQAGCSQREFARRIVMDPSKLSRSLGGSRRFTAAELARVADAGSVDAAWLLGTAAFGGTRTRAGAGAPAEPVGAAANAPGSLGRSALLDPGAGAGASPEHAPAPAPDPRTRNGTPRSGRPLQIVRETVRLIAEHGFRSVRVSDIAEACATSTAAIHYHFPGRAELLEAAVRWCMDEDIERRAARIADAEDAADELRQLIELQTPRTAQQRQQWLVWLDLWAEAVRSTAIGRLHVDYYRQWRTTVAEVVRRGIAQGVFRDVDPEFSALRLIALIDGLAAQVLAATGGDDDAPPASPPAGPAPVEDAGGESAPSGTTPEDMRTALLAHVETELLTPAD